MRYDCQGFWSDSFCDIEVHRRTDGKYVFVATELRDNPGTSVTNFAEHLEAMLRQYGLKPADVIWIEHYPKSKDHQKEDFDLVRFLDIEGDSFRSPVWRRITEQAVEDLIAGVRKLEDLLPRRVKGRNERGTGLGR